MKKNIVLIGFMGAGKSLVAQRLSRMLGVAFASTDQLIEQKEQRTVAEVFRDSGEEYFRKLEKEIVVKLAQKKNIIIDCGGGVVIQNENLINLKKTGILFYFYTSPEVIYRRTKFHSTRPLLNVSDPLAKIKELLAKRKSYYEQADYVIDTDLQTVEQTADAVLKQLKSAKLI